MVSIQCTLVEIIMAFHVLAPIEHLIKELLDGGGWLVGEVKEKNYGWGRGGTGKEAEYGQVVISSGEVARGE